MVHLEELDIVCVALQPSGAVLIRDFESMNGAQIASDDAIDPALYDMVAKGGMPAKEGNFEKLLHER